MIQESRPDRHLHNVVNISILQGSTHPSAHTEAAIVSRLMFAVPLTATGALGGGGGVVSISEERVLSISSSVVFFSSRREEERHSAGAVELFRRSSDKIRMEPVHISSRHKWQRSQKTVCCVTGQLVSSYLYLLKHILLKNIACVLLVEYLLLNNH